MFVEVTRSRSVRGIALWSDPRFPSVDLSVKLDGAATASGELRRAVSFVTGQISGTIVFSNSAGARFDMPNGVMDDAAGALTNRLSQLPKVANAAFGALFGIRRDRVTSVTWVPAP